MNTPTKRIRKGIKESDVAYPGATLAFYGPDNNRAIKAVLGIFLHDGAEPTIYTYVSDETDARESVEVLEGILARLREHDVRLVREVVGIFGCPHEEDIDYPEGLCCPQCPFWKNKDRTAETHIQTYSLNWL